MDQKPLLGAHFSTAGGLEKAIYRAHRYRCPTLQIFTKNARTWAEKTLTDTEISRFNKAKKETKITKIISHASYLINIASDDKEKYQKSKNALRDELLRSSELGIESVVLHPGSHLGQGADKGIEIATQTINSIFEETDKISSRLVLETTAGQGTNLGYNFEQLAKMINKTKNKSKIGICIDTCHIYTAGYDISSYEAVRSTFEKFDSIVGFEHLFVLHLNDSIHKLGSKKDRHDHIGQGFIGKDAFNFIMQDSKLVSIPKIIETPKNNKEDVKKDMDLINLKILQDSGKAPAL